MTSQEERLSQYLLRAVKFEFYLISEEPTFAQTNGSGRVTGIQWGKVAKKIEDKKCSFKEIPDSFIVLKKNPPRFLRKEDNQLTWSKRDDVAIESWRCLLKKGLAQLRNNIAHGSKALPHMDVEQGRVESLLEAGTALMGFIAKELFSDNNWEQSITLQ